MAKTKKASKTIEGDIVKFEFSTGQTLEADLNKLPDEMKLKLALHGLSQKLGDSYAGAEDGEAYECANKVLEDLVAGNWSSRVAGAGSPRTTMLAEALALAANVTVEEAVAKIADMDDEKVKAIRNHQVVKAKLAEIKAKRAAEAAAAAAKDLAEAGPIEL